MRGTCAACHQYPQKNIDSIAGQCSRKNKKATSSHKKPVALFPLFVDQEGIEPSSKQGKKMLSTCLSLSLYQP